ncbi:hypothetical protein [Planobispora rosea]|uniref:hypothetical protein n=1 Tax=Planobispora rosea TaxID=35762 RepID=UPI00083AC2C8|nr:hypothetical protein [Planobispora rosea]
MTTPLAGRTAAALVVGLSLIPAVPASAATAGWSDTYAHGSVSVPADRSTIKVCDGKVDNLVYKVIWHNDNPVDARDSFVVQAPQGRCATDSSWLGSVMVFKLCHGRIGSNNRTTWDACKAPVWPGRR